MGTDPSYPLISCLCITENRVHKLESALNCFYAQQYPNKELVVVYREDDGRTAEYMAHLDRPDIVPVKVSSAARPSLGELRNLSITHAGGAYFCQWDDDDWYHHDRLAVQMQAVQQNRYDASLLVHLLLFDEEASELYLSYYRPWEGSMLCKRNAFSELVQYPAFNKGEDTEFTNRVLSNYRIYPVTAPQLYIYVFHGANTWDQQHFRRLYTHSQKLSDRAAQLVRAVVRNEYSVTEASALLGAREFCEEFDYFFYLKTQYLRERRIT